MSGFGSKAENICSLGVFRILTLTGHSLEIAVCTAWPSLGSI